MRIRILLSLFFSFLTLSSFAQFELTLQVGHYGKSVDLDFSPDAKQMATAATDHSVKIWDADSGALLKTFEGMGYIRRIKYVEDGRLLLIASHNKIRFIDLKTGGVSHQVEYPSPRGNFDEVIVSPKNHFLAARPRRGTLHLWEVKTGKLLHSFPNLPSESKYRFSSDDSLFVYGKPYQYSGKNETIIWDIRAAKELKKLPNVMERLVFDEGMKNYATFGYQTLKIYKLGSGEEKIIKGVKGDQIIFSPDGKYIAVFNMGPGQLRIWETSSGKLVYDQSFKGNLRYNFMGKFSTDNKSFFCYYKRIIRRLDLKTLTWDKEYQASTIGDFSTDGQYFFSGNTVMNVETGAPASKNIVLGTDALAKFGPHSKKAGIFNKYSIRIIRIGEGKVLEKPLRSSTFRLRFSPTWQTFASGSSKFVKVWDMDSYDLLLAKQFSNEITDFQFHPIEDQVGVIDRVSHFYSINIKNGKIGNRFPISEGAFRFAYNPDLRSIRSIEWNKGSYSSSYARMSQWDLKKHELKFTKTAIRSLASFSALAFIPDGKILATGHSSGEVLLWRPGAKNSFWTHVPDNRSKSRVNNVVFAPQGKLLAADVGKEILIWDVKSKKLLRKLGHKYYTSAICFSPDSKTLFSTASNIIKSWNLETGQEIKAMKGGYWIIQSLAFNPKRNHLLSAGGGDHFKIWDLDRGEALFSIYELEEEEDFLALSPEGIYYTNVRPEKYLSYTDSLRQIPNHDNFPFQVFSIAELETEIATIHKIMGTDKKAVFTLYKRKLFEKLVASNLFGPKGEFETEAQYEQRRKKAILYRHEQYQFFRNAFEEFKNSKEQQRIARIRESLEEIKLPALLLGNYDAEKEVFQFRIMGQTLAVKVPLDEAPSLKANSDQLYAVAYHQLQENEMDRDTFNIRVEHPLTDSWYPFGKQRPPLYLPEQPLSQEEQEADPVVLEQEESLSISSPPVDEKLTSEMRPELDFSPQKKVQAPIITWLNPPPSITQQPNYQARIRIASATPLFSTYLTVNGRRSDCKLQATVTGAQLNCTISLREGENNFYLEAINQGGRSMSDVIRIRYRPPFLRKDYALIISVENYQDQTNWQKLNNTIKGGAEIGIVLKERYGFEVQHLQDPTLEQMYKTLEHYSQKAYGPYDQLLVMFNGHGDSRGAGGNRKIGYLVASDSQGDSRRTYLSHSELATLLDASDCPHILLVMDACFSSLFGDAASSSREGANPRGKYLNRQQSKSDYLKRLLKPVSRLYLSSGATEVLAGKGEELSPFTKLLYEALVESQPEEEIRNYNIISFDQIRDRFIKSSLNPPANSNRFGRYEPGGKFLFEIKN